MARGRRKASNTVKTVDYRHKEEKRTNIPPAKIAGEGRIPRVEKARYHYSPHLSPSLRFDPTGASDQLPDLITEAGKRRLTASEQQCLAEALRQHEPWLEWAGKREQHEKGFFEIDPVALHIHERVSAQAIIKAAKREDLQRDLFADPQQDYREAVQFYRHSMDWANRLILGDSLQAMSSLARRENLAGKVQLIYIDPPYGIKFGSNFQPQMGLRDVKEKEEHVTREAELVKAYRDTWQLGIHSYLTYLKQRLQVARELLKESGSIFIQISDTNLHRVRSLLDEVFGSQNFLSLITFQTTTGFESATLATMGDFLLWYAKEKSSVQYNKLYIEQELIPGEGNARWLYLSNRDYRGVSAAEKRGDKAIPEDSLHYKPDNISSQGAGGQLQPFEFEGRNYHPASNSHWKANYPTGMSRLAAANRIHVAKNSIQYRRYWSDYPFQIRGNIWSDTGTGSFTESKMFVVQTNTKVIERCILMTTNPGDLVVDPTCGSGTTALVAEQWGRRWITVDTSRVAVSIARQRILTARHDYFELADETKGVDGGFSYSTIPHITLKSIAQNANLDPIVEKHAPLLDKHLEACNTALSMVDDDLRTRLKSKLISKEKTEGKRKITDSDRRRWLMPPDHRDPKVKLTVDTKFNGWYHWEVPFDTDPDWPQALTDAVIAYRDAWRIRMDEINACIETNAEQEKLVDQPKVARNVVRVSGPFTVEGVNPEELNLGEEGLFDGSPDSLNNLADDHGNYEVQNLHAYLDRMVRYLRDDGLTFLNNRFRKFARVEPLYESSNGNILHAEALWDDADPSEPASIAIVFGPQCGPVTAAQVEEAIRASRRYDELVIAGFSFDAAASAVIQENLHPRLTIHQAYIRPDISPGMEGLLKETPNSQLFTVFGQPEVEVREARDGVWEVELLGVDIYDPVRNTIQSTGADKVAAWFLDSDFDGRTFCITQAFFPNQDAWGKIARALKSDIDESAFETFKGTVSLPFSTGPHRRIAVKVIDPRGNEVMTVRSLTA